MPAHEHVRKPDAGGGDADPDLTRTGRGDRQLGQLQDFRGLAGSLHLPGSHQETTVPFSIMVAALCSSPSTWRPKYSCTGLSDWPRRNLA